VSRGRANEQKGTTRHLQRVRAGPARLPHPSPCPERAPATSRHGKASCPYRVSRHISTFRPLKPLAGGLKDQCKDRAAAGVVSDLHGAAVRLHDLADDGETEPGALSRTCLPAPEAVEDVPAIGRRDAGTAIDDMDDTWRLHVDDDLSLGRGVG